MGAIVGLILFGVPSAIIAGAKGFRPFRWLIAMGVVGLIFVASLSSAKAANIPDEEREARAEKADRIGATLAMISIALSILLTMISLVMR